MNTFQKYCLAPVMVLGFLSLSPQALAAPAAGSASEAKSHQVVKPVAPAQDGIQLSINSASAEELEQLLSGVGAKKAQAIVSYRESHGPFKALDELRNVPGFGPALVERNLPHLKL
ncbi:hypothetical protein TUM12370_28570 [Salmonella enterica subsp. enterica serovar Choleraesuis]|nr:hypothetical protein TUM12370_28570 [Salmonella enterica subsp. enterica serovar Choleraesuis]